MFRQRVLILSAFAAFGVGCALTEESAVPAVSDDGGSLGTDVVTLDTAEASNVTNLTVAEFIGHVDEAGELTIELLPVEEWISPVDERSLFGLRDVAQANWCELRVTQGRPETVGLSTIGGSIGFNLAACGLPDVFPFNATGAFCADIEVSNFYPQTLTDVYAEITSITPDAGYGGFTYSATGGLIGADPTGLTGNNAPTDIAGGLFGYGDIAGNSAQVQQWAFQNEGGVFSFRGRVLGVVAESCDGVDNDCDGDIDEQAGCLALGDSCLEDLDCETGNCDAGVCGASLCSDGIQNGTETDIDCGGACDPCADGLQCLVDEDCTSDICLDGTCAAFDRPTPGDLVITEFYANPDGDETVREFVEVYNRTGAGLNLNGCSLTDGSETYVWATDAIVPDGYGVLARGGAPTADDAPAGDVTYDSFILANSGDTIRIECNGLVVDEVVYTEAQDSGVTTQLDAGVLTALANDDPANFCTTPTSTFGPLGVRGTPGAANDACPSFDLQTGDFCTIDLAGTVSATAAGSLRTQASLSIAGLTDGSDDVDTLAAVQVQLGFGPTGFAEFDPAWTWETGVAVNDWYDTYGVDGYEALLTMPSAGTYVLAARVSTDNGATFTYCDRRLGPSQRGSEDGFLLADAVQLTVDAGVATPSAAGEVFFTELMPNAVNPASEVAEFFELFNPGSAELDLDGCIIADNNRPGNDHVIQGAVRIAPGEYLVITYSGSFDENYGLLGDYSIDGEFNLSNGGDSIVLECGGTVIDSVVWDSEGDFDNEGISNQLMPTRSDDTSNDTLDYWCYTPTANTYGDGTHVGTPGAANPPCATLDACRLQSPTTITSGAPNATVEVTGRLQSLGLSDQTTGSDANPAVVAEVGWGADGTDPAAGGWTWYAATTDGTWEDSSEVGFDQYTGTLTLPSTGLFDFDFAYRFSADAGLNYVYCDTTDGDATYTAADAGQGSTAEIVDLTGVTCGVDAALSGFAGIATTASATVDFVASCGTPSSALVVEVGYGPAGGDASLDAGDFTYTAVSFDACSSLQGQFSGGLVAPTAFDANAGAFELAGRVSGDGGATWIYCDGNAGAYASADNGLLTVESATADVYAFDIGTSQTATEFATVTVGMQWADAGTPSLTELTPGVDVSSDVTIECGWAADGVDPVANPNDWNWFAASPIAGWNDGFGFDGWDCDLTVPAAGTYDTAFRISTDAGATYTYVDTVGNAVFSAPGELIATADPNAPCLLFTEYVEGSSNNKGLEVHNCGDADVNLADIQVCWENNSNTTCDTAVSLGSTGVLPAGGVFTLCASAWALAPVCDLSLPFPAPVYFNGDDRVGLFRDINADGEYGAGEPLYDFILESGFNDPSDPGQNLTWRRRTDACTSYNGQGAFVPSAYYTEHPQNDVDDFGTFAGCINAQFVELLEGDNGAFTLVNTTVVPTGLVLDAGAGASIGLPPLDCTGEGDVTVTAVISATDCTSNSSIDVDGQDTAQPVVGTQSFTVPSTAGVSSVSPVVNVTGVEACTVTLDAVYASCPAIAPTLAVGDVIVSEVSVDGPTTWIELANVTGGALDVTGLQVSVDGLRFVVTSAAFGSGDYYAASADGTVGTGNFGLYGVTLTNASTITVLAGSTVLDTVSLDGGTLFPSGATGSINLSDTKLTALDNDAATSWCTSDTQTWNGGANFGSPGLANDACPSLGNTPTTYDQLVITEFQPLGDGDYEFVEFFNPTGQDFDLAGCTFGDNSSAPQDVLIGTDGSGDTVIEAGTYFVFGATADAVTDNSGTSLVDYVYGSGNPGLSGSGDHIEVECGGVTIAAIDYNGTDFGYDATTTVISSQLDVRHLNTYSALDSAYWCGTATGTYFAEPGGTVVRQGTPGAANEACGGVAAPATPAVNEVITTELTGSPSPSGDAEFVELYNTTAVTLDLAGVHWSDDGSPTFAFPANTLIGPGEYLVVAGFADAVVDAEGTSLVDVVFDSMSGLGGSGDASWLCTDGGCTSFISQLTGTDAFTASQSRSLDPGWVDPADAGFDDNSKWCDDSVNAYLDGFGGSNTGTPGAVNYDCPGIDPATAPPTAQNLLLTEWADPGNDTGARFYEIYNASGADVDLSNYEVRRWTNGNTEFTGSTVDALTGTLAAGATFVVCRNATDFATAYPTATCDFVNSSSGTADSNGDDQAGIFFVPTGAVVDFFGQVGEDGTGTDHDFADGRVERACSSFTGVTDTTDFTANASNWNVVAGGLNAPGDYDPGTWSCVTPANLFFTELADPGNETGARYVEIYNNSGASVDLSSYALRRWTNGNTDAQSSDTALTGTLADGAFYVVCNNDSTFNATYSVSCDQSIGSGGPADSNGDDQIALVFTVTDAVVDFFGQVGEDGTGTDHDFADGRVERDCSSTTGVTNTTDFTAVASNWVVVAGGQDAPADFDPAAWSCLGPAEVDACINNPCTGSNVTCTDIAGPDDTTAGRTCSCDIGGESYDELTGCTAPSGTPNVFFTEVSDPNDNANAKYVEIYNGGTADADLSDYRIDAYFNGSMAVGQAVTLGAATLAPGEAWVICASSSTFNSAFSPVTCDEQQGSLNSNGDETYVLVQVSTSTTLDILGVIGVDGTGTSHEWEDGGMQRVCGTTGSATWDAANWTVRNDSALSPPVNVADGFFTPGEWVCP